MRFASSHECAARGLARASACACAAFALSAAIGCASPGHPLPPSLFIPRPVTGLTAARIGDHVQLHWTTPANTTDGVRLPAAGIVAQICRSPGAAPPKTCSAIAEVPAHAGPSSFDDHLPPALASGPPAPLAYRIQLLGPTRKTAGPSAAALTVTGQGLPDLAQFRVLDTPLGAQLQWTADASPKPGESIFLDRTPDKPASPQVRPASTQSSPARESAQSGPPQPDRATVRLTPGPGDPGGVLDRTAALGQSYTYTAQRIRTVLLAGQTIDMRSNLAGPVAVTLRDIFPPPPPTSLAGSPGPGSIDLSWEPVEPLALGQRVTGYRVYRSSSTTASDSPAPADDNPSATAQSWQLLNPAPIPIPAYRDEYIEAGRSYSYRVTALDSANHESPPSPSIRETAPQP